MRAIASQQGVQEYWIVNKNLQQIQLYRRDQAALTLAATLQATDALTSPLMPDFACPLSHIFGRPKAAS
ncbi:MAG: Uma2 family endonuclease [Elainellaceae cyanobacterium]